MDTNSTRFLEEVAALVGSEPPGSAQLFGGPGGKHLWRDVHVLRITDGWITEHTLSCTGIWDPATIAGHAS